MICPKLRIANTNKWGVCLSNCPWKTSKITKLATEKLESNMNCQHSLFKFQQGQKKSVVTLVAT